MARQFDFDHYTIPNPELYEPCRVVQYVPGSNDPRQSLFLWIPKGKTSFPVAIWVHGGGMVFEAADPCDQLFDGTRAVAAVRYRLSPDHVAPAQHEDVAAAVAWIYRECVKYNSVIKPLACQLFKISGSFGRKLGQKFYRKLPAVFHFNLYFCIIHLLLLHSVLVIL